MTEPTPIPVPEQLREPLLEVVDGPTHEASAPAAFAFLTNHGKALLLLARDSRIRIRDLALLLGITERAGQRIVADLDRTGYIERAREGRRNRYTVRTHLPLGLPTQLGLPKQRDSDIRSLLALLPDTPHTSTAQAKGTR